MNGSDLLNMYRQNKESTTSRKKNKQETETVTGRDLLNNYRNSKNINIPETNYTSNPNPVSNSLIDASMTVANNKVNSQTVPANIGLPKVVAPYVANTTTQQPNMDISVDGSMFPLYSAANEQKKEKEKEAKVQAVNNYSNLLSNEPQNVLSNQNLPRINDGNNVVYNTQKALTSVTKDYASEALNQPKTQKQQIRDYAHNAYDSLKETNPEAYEYLSKRESAADTAKGVLYNIASSIDNLINYDISNMPVEARGSKSNFGEAAGNIETETYNELKNKYGMSDEEALYWSNAYRNFNGIIENEQSEKTRNAYIANYDADTVAAITEFVKAKRNLAFNYDNSVQSKAKYLYQVITLTNDLKNKGINVMDGGEYQQLAEYLDATYGEEENEQLQQKISDFVEKYPAASIPLNIYDVGMSPVSGIAATVGTWANDLTKMDKSQVSNTYGSWYKAQNLSEAIQNATNEQIGDNEAGQFWYGVGSSTAKSVYSMALGNVIGQGLASVGAGSRAVAIASQAATLPSFGGTSYATTLQDQLEKGMGNDDAQAYAFITGINEMLYEEISLDKAYGIYNAAKMGKVGLSKTIQNIIAQAGIEGSEEVFTDLSNALADAIINTDFSDHNMLVREYMSSGMSKEEAENAATKDEIAKVTETFAAGAISGGFTGLVMTGAGTYNYRSTAKNILSSESRTAAFIEEVKASAEEGSTARNIVENKAANELTTTDIANILQSLEETSAKNASNKNSDPVATMIENALIRDGETAEQAKQDAATILEMETQERANYSLENELNNKLRSGQQVTTEDLQRIAEAQNNTKANAEKLDANPNLSNVYDNYSTGKLQQPSAIAAAAQYVARQESKAARQEKIENVIDHTKANINRLTGKPVDVVSFEELSNDKKVVKTNSGNVELSEVRFADNLRSRLINSISEIENVTAANYALKNYSGQDLQSYTILSKYAYHLGENGESFDNITNSKSIATQRMLAELQKTDPNNSYLQTMYNEGKKTIKERTKDTVNKEAAKNAKKYDVQENDKLVDFKKLLGAYSGANMLTDYAETRFNAAWTANNATIQSNPAAANAVGNEYSAIVHEMFEYARSLAPESYEELKQAVLTFARDSLGDSRVNQIIENYRNVYRKSGIESEKNKTFSEAADEFVNDFMSGAFSTEKGAQQFIEHIAKSTEYNAETKANILETFADWINHLLDTIKNFLTGKGQQLGAQEAMQLEKAGKDLTAIRDMALKALDEARAELNSQVNSENVKTDVSSEEANNSKYSLNVSDVVNRDGITITGIVYDSEGRLRLNNVDKISDYNWKKIFAGVNRAGYGFASVEQLKTRFSELAELNAKQGGYLLTDEQAKVFEKVFKLQDITPKQSKEEELKKIGTSAARFYGVTENYNKAGYMTVNGSLLDFSDGQRTRVKDHREINEFLDEKGIKYGDNYSDSMIEFMNLGNIRMQTYGIDIATMPTKQQQVALKKFFSYLNGEVTVDFSNEKGDSVGSVEYSKGTSSARIINDIESYFETGNVPEGNAGSLASFYKYSLNVDSEGNKLTKSQISFFENSKIRDSEGKLMPMYHGTQTGGFTVFDIKKARSNGHYGSGFYFSASPLTAYSSGDVYKVYLNIVNPVSQVHPSKTITKAQLTKYVQELADNEDYGIEGYGRGATVKSIVNELAGKDNDFRIFNDINATCIGDFAKAVKLFNEANGTNFDGIEVFTETVAFSPEQIKLTDNKEPSKDQDIRYSLDVKYMDAVKKSDLETAKKALDEYAESKGYKPVVRYHQTSGRFTVFNNDNPVAALNDSATPNGYFFKDNDHDIGIGGDTQMEVYLKSDNMLRFKDREEATEWYRKNVPNYKDIDDEWQSTYANDYEPEFKRIEDLEFSSETDEEFDKYMEEETALIEKLGKVEDEYRGKMRKALDDYFINSDSGYDGIELDYDGHRYVNGKRENVHTYIVFKNTQIKSSNVIELDDQKNIIPLEKRFDDTNPDIRYSVNVTSIDNEIGKYEIEKWNDYIHVQKQIVKGLGSDWFDNNETVVNKASGNAVHISRNSVKESFSKGKRFATIPKTLKRLKVATIRFIPDIIENAVLKEANIDNIYDAENGNKFDYYETPIVIEGQDATVRIAVEKATNKDIFYIHYVDVIKNENQQLNESTNMDITEFADSHSPSINDNGNNVNHSIDVDYNNALDNDNIRLADIYVNNAAVEWGAVSEKDGIRDKAIKLYHGTNRFGYTEYDLNQNTDSKGMIYLTTKSNVAANYAGRDYYAHVRNIGKKYIDNATSSKDIISNFNNVFDETFSEISNDRRNEIISKYRDEAIAIADKLDEHYYDMSDTVISDDEYLNNAFSCMVSMFWTIRDMEIDDYTSEEDVYNQLQTDIEWYNKYHEEVRQAFIDNKNQFENKGDDSLYNMITGFELSDTVYDVVKLMRIYSGKDVAANSKDEVRYISELNEKSDLYHNIGSYQMYARLGDNPYIIDSGGRDWLSVPNDIIEYKDENAKLHGSSTDRIAAKARDLGYTSVVIRNVIDGGETADDYILFRANDVKSADTITYDENGNVIPLEQRFSDRNDFRYSLDVSEQNFLDAVMEMDADITRSMEKTVATLNKVMDFESDIPEKAVYNAAKAIKNKYNSTLSIKRIESLISDHFNYIRDTGNLNYDELELIAQTVGMDVVQSIDAADLGEAEAYKKFHDVLYTYRLKLTSTQMQEVISKYGSYNNYKRMLSGEVRLNKNANDMTGEWEEMSQLTDGVLPANVSEGQQPIVLLETVNAMKPKHTMLQNMSDEEASMRVAMDILQEYFKASAQKDAEIAAAESAKDYNKIIKDRYTKRFNEALKELERAKAVELERLTKEYESLNKEEQAVYADIAGAIESAKNADEKAALQNKLKAAQDEIKIAKLQYQYDIKALKNQNSEQLAAIKANYANKRQQDKDRAKHRELMTQIKKEVAALQNALSHPKSGASRSVPVELVNATIDMLEAINLSTGNNKALEERLKKLADVYQSLRQNVQSVGDDTHNYGFDYDERIAADLAEVRQIFEGGKYYGELYVPELQRILDIVRALRTQIRNANNLIIDGQVEDARKVAVDAMKEVTESRKGKNEFTRVLDKYATMHLNPYREFRKISGYTDGAVMKIFDNLEAASLREMSIQKELGEIYSNVLEGKKNQAEVKRFISTKESDLVDIGIVDEHGKPVKVSRAMRMSLIMHSKNEGNMRHVIFGGMNIADMTRVSKNKSDAYGEYGKIYRVLDYSKYLAAARDGDYAEVNKLLTDARNKITSLENDLSEWEKRFLAAAQEMFYNRTGDLINKTSVELKGYTIARVKNYFPIKTDTDFTPTDFAGLIMDGTIEGMGMLKERVQSKKPIMLEDITDVIQRQIKNVSKYAAFAIPVRNFNLAMKQTFRDSRGEGTTLERRIREVWGSSNLETIRSLINNIQSNSKTESGTGFFNKLRGNFAGSVLTLNPSVAIKQAASYPTAAATLGYLPLIQAVKDMPKGFAQQQGIAELEKINPLLWYRSQGYASQDLADAKAVGFGKNLPVNMQKAIGWTQFMDTGTVRTLEYAAKYYVDNNFKKLPKGTEAYWNKVSEVFTQVVTETQPNYDTVHKANIIRDGNSFIKMLVMFKTQPMQNFGIIYDALGELHAESVRAKNHQANHVKDSAEKFARAVTSQLMSAVTFSAMSILANLLLHRWGKYRDDDDEWSWEKLLAALGEGALSAFLGMFLGAQEIFDTFKYWKKELTGESNNNYYGIDVSTIEMINNFSSAVGRVFGSVNDLWEAKTSAERDTAIQKLVKNSDKLADYTGQILGIPVGNIKNITQATYLYTVDAVNSSNGNVGISSQQYYYDWQVSSQYERMYEAFLNNDMNEYNKLVEEMIAKGKSEDSIESNLKSIIKEEYQSGVLSYDDTMELLERYGYDEAGSYYQIGKWDSGINSDYGRLQMLVQNAADDPSNENRKLVVDEVNTLIGYGKEKDKILSSLKNKYKDAYIEAYNNGDVSNLNAILRQALVAAGYTDDEAKEKLKKWVE